MASSSTKKIRSEQARFDNATHIVFACHNGERSEVCRKTAKNPFGYPLERRDVNLVGGYLAWKDHLQSNLKNGNNGWQFLLKSPPASTLSHGEQSHLAFAAPKSPRDDSSSVEPGVQPSERKATSFRM